MNDSFTKKGDSLELRTAGYFQAQGYLVRRGVMLSVSSQTADATDIDLLALRFTVPLNEERLVADCKDRKRPKPFERILWTRGLASFSNATQAIVVLPKAMWQVREFASEGKIQVLEAFEVDRYLKTASSRYIPFSDADPVVSRLLYQNTDRDLFREDLRLRQMLVFGHPLTNLNRVIKTLQMNGKSALNVADKHSWMRRYVCFNAAVIAGVMLVRFAVENKWTPEKDWADYARKRLTFGDVSPQKARQLAQLALERNIPETIPAPPYTREIVAVLGTLINNPRVASLLPYALDFYLCGDRLRHLAGVNGSPRIIDAQYEDALRLGKRILSALAYAADLPATFWEVERPKEKAPKQEPPLHAEGSSSVNGHLQGATEPKDEPQASHLAASTDSKVSSDAESVNPSINLPSSEDTSAVAKE